MSTDYYKTLGVKRSADASEIKKAYRKLARKFHPDVNPGNDEAEGKFKEIQEAYAVLSDSKRKKQYDTFGTVDGDPTAGFDPFRQARGRAAGGRGPGGFRVDFDGAGGFQDLGDVFSQFFGGSAQARPRQAPKRGANQELAVEVGFADAVQGTTISLPVQRQLRCSDCGGSGKAVRGACPNCHGAGQVISTERMRVKVPEGVADGNKVRVAGKGAEGARGGSSGDLFVKVSVRPHAFFERDGDNIHTTVPVTFWKRISAVRSKSEPSTARCEPRSRRGPTRAAPSASAAKGSATPRRGLMATTSIRLRSWFPRWSHPPEKKPQSGLASSTRAIRATSCREHSR